MHVRAKCYPKFRLASGEFPMPAQVVKARPEARGEAFAASRNFGEHLFVFNSGGPEKGPGGVYMFCPQCGKEYSQQVNYCCHCGAALSTSVATAGRNKKLMRSRTDRKIAGVCAGFAAYLDVDVTLVRILWLMLVVVGGWGVIGYLIAWIAMPEEAAAKASVATEPSTSPAGAAH